MSWGAASLCSGFWPCPSPRPCCGWLPCSGMEEPGHSAPAGSHVPSCALGAQPAGATAAGAGQGRIPAGGFLSPGQGLMPEPHLPAPLKQEANAGSPACPCWAGASPGAAGQMARAGPADWASSWSLSPPPCSGHWWHWCLASPSPSGSCSRAHKCRAPPGTARVPAAAAGLAYTC